MFIRGLISLQTDVLMELKEVTAGYPGHVALKDISFRVKKKEAIAVVGPNGGGKSTLLKVIMGLIEPQRGEVLILGEKPYKNHHLKSKIAYLPQQSTINPHFPALIEDIVQLGLFSELGLLKRPTKAHKERVIASLEKVDLQDMLGELYEHLSGGQKQRVLIARAIVSKPEIIMLDEPTTGLDVFSQESILKVVRELTEEEHLTVIAVTHDQVFLRRWAERVIQIQQQLTFDGLASKFFQRGEE